jgi:D-arabinose 1-dehydrogenase-like Zn-dependent alcohol dehydrogenase
MAAVVDLLAAGKVSPPHLQERSLDQAATALEDMEDRRLTGKVVLRPAA